MRTIKIDGNLSEITNEPGDCTRYDYFCIKYFDDYLFAPKDNTFRYPSRINYYDAKRILEEPVDSSRIHEISNNNYCNYHTTLECCKAILELHELYTETNDPNMEIKIGGEYKIGKNLVATVHAKTICDNTEYIYFSYTDHKNNYLCENVMETEKFIKKCQKAMNK